MRVAALRVFPTVLRRAVPVPLAAALLAACDSGPFVPFPGDVTIEVQVSGSTLAPGDTLDIDVVVTNQTRRTITWSSSACPVSVELNGGPVPQPARLTGLACIAVVVPHVLGPRQSEVMTFPFDGMAWQAQSPSGPEVWVQLGAGGYDIVAEILGPYAASSPPVGIEILP